MSIDKSEVTIGIVTALPEEYHAVKAILENVEDSSEQGDPSYYTMGQIMVRDNFGGGIHKVALSISPKMGNNSASAIASHLTRTFTQVKHLFMVGIAGGMSQHVELGDIVVAKKIVQYDFGKREGGDKFVPKGDPLSASESLLKVHRYLELQKPQYPWHGYLDAIINSLNGQDLGLKFGFERPDNPEKRPSVFCETIGSANTVLKDDQFRDKLFSEDGFFSEYRIYAVEMEGSGIADAATMQGLNFMVIRGICDYCDPEKNDKWHGYAAAVAAAYTKALIEVLPIKDSSKKLKPKIWHPVGVLFSILTLGIIFFQFDGPGSPTGDKTDIITIIDVDEIDWQGSWEDLHEKANSWKHGLAKDKKQEGTYYYIDAKDKVGCVVVNIPGYHWVNGKVELSSIDGKTIFEGSAWVQQFNNKLLDIISIGSASGEEQKETEVLAKKRATRLLGLLGQETSFNIALYALTLGKLIKKNIETGRQLVFLGILKREAQTLKKQDITNCLDGWNNYPYSIKIPYSKYNQFELERYR